MGCFLRDGPKQLGMRVALAAKRACDDARIAIMMENYHHSHGHIILPVLATFAACAAIHKPCHTIFGVGPKRAVNLIVLLNTCEQGCVWTIFDFVFCCVSPAWLRLARCFSWTIRQLCRKSLPCCCNDPVLQQQKISVQHWIITCVATVLPVGMTPGCSANDVMPLLP